jgi:hypothetical protein
MNRLRKNRCAKPRFDTVGQDEINRSVKKVFEKELKIHVRVERLPLQFDYKIKVTLGRSLSTCTRAKEA